jgi:hypothetical protein
MKNVNHQMLDQELKRFTSRNFERPSDCRNLEQIRYYVQELCDKIRYYEQRFNYVPDWAYALLAQYNARQNAMICQDFIRTYR